MSARVAAALVAFAGVASCAVGPGAADRVIGDSHVGGAHTRRRAAYHPNPPNRSREESRRVRQAARLAAKRRNRIRIAADTICGTLPGGAS
jgi:hypothetical protein